MPFGGRRTAWLLAVGMFALPDAATAQSSTALVVCAIHYGDSATHTDVTPAAEITTPFPTFSDMGLDIAWRITAAKLTPRYYKTACARGSSVDDLRKRLKQWQNNSGYGERPLRAITFQDSFPSILDQMHLQQGMRPQPRAAFVAREIGPVLRAAENEAIRAEREKRLAAEANRKPAEKLEIGISQAGKAPVREAEDRYQRDLAAYGEALASQRMAQKAYEEALAAEAGKARANAEKIAAAKAAHDAAKAAHDAEVARAEQARAAYRAEYRRVTGRDPQE